MTSGAAIWTRGLSRSFGAVRALSEVSIEADRGCVLAMLGHNGAGKTTLVNILSTLLPPSAGEARVAGFDVVRDAAHVRRRIGLTGQYASLDERVSGRDNLVLVARLLGAGRREARERADELLDLFDLADAGSRQVWFYSGGMRRRLDLAVSLIASPEVIFLDEPTTGLDPRSRAALWDQVAAVARNGSTVVLTTQHLEEADRLADVVTVFSRGRLIASGPVGQLKAEAGQRTVTALLPLQADPSATVAALAGVGLSGKVAGAAVSAPVTSQHQFTAAVRALDDAGVDVLEVTFRGPTLDDVYLALTGHAAPPAKARRQPLRQEQ